MKDNKEKSKCKGFWVRENVKCPFGVVCKNLYASYLCFLGGSVVLLEKKQRA